MEASSAAVFGDMSFESYSAELIQRVYRGHRVRRDINRKRRAVRRISYAWLGLLRRKQKPQKAVPIIQRAWRYFSQRRIFKYYRDLIKFREKGNPADLLRCINYREAQLCAAGAGLHVRFRLGGNTFPPLVFYKIYTHNTVTDIGAFAPRDYVRETKKTQDEIKVHNYRSKAGDFYDDFMLDADLREYRKADGTTGLRDEKGWYMRSENNGWRPVAEKALVEAEEITRQTARLRASFSHIPQQRKDDLIRRRKQKKREWMTKLYMLGKTGKEPGLGELKGAVGEGDGDDTDPLDDLSDEDLLKWTETLDFESYVDGWTELATSNSSEAYIPVPDSTAFLEGLGDKVPFYADSATLFAQNYIPSEPFKSGMGVKTVNFRASDLRT